MTTVKYNKIGIIGAGAWGTALATACCRAGRDVLLWGRNHQLLDHINDRHENPIYLPDVKLPENLTATANMADIADCDLILIVTPAQFFRTILQGFKTHLNGRKMPLVLCSKGIEIETGAMLSTIAHEICPDNPVAILSGPSFAAEVARNYPTGLTLACDNLDMGMDIIQSIGSKTCRIYYSDDVTGAQICGAVKNVMAIACGIVYGKKLGDNARALILTRGLEEIWRLAAVMGAKRETLMGLAGLGDLTLTCSSVQSRNFSLGVALGEGQSLADILATRKSVTEGIHTAAALSALAHKQNVDMPICYAANAILNEGLPLEKAIADLMARPFRMEHE